MQRSIAAACVLWLAACHANGIPSANPNGSLYAVRLHAAPQTAAERALPLVYWSEQRTGADTLAIHVLRVDLQSHALEVDAIVADDPDGSGPAEAALTDPLALAQRNNALAAVNANAFAGLPDSTGKPDSRWRAALPVNIAGIAVHDGIVRSNGADNSAVDAIFAIDKRDQPYIGVMPKGVALEEAVNGWSFTMLEDGNLPTPGGPRHPRTAVGTDATGRWLYLVVVDGRQPGYSNGVTARELAEVMLRVGAERALNLDGGGSSVLLVASGAAGLQIINRPSGGQLRPVPVLLTVHGR